MWLELLGDGTVSGAMVMQPSIAALRSPPKDELYLGEDFFSWPHPTRSGEALFVVDDVAERVTTEVASRSHERVRAALTEMGVVATMIARLGAEARHQMIDDVDAQAQESFLAVHLHGARFTLITVI
jgi:hypothetical protein